MTADVTRPEAPLKLGEPVRELRLVDNLVIALGERWVHMVDVTDAAAPRLVTTYPSREVTTFNPQGIEVHDGLLFVAVALRGLQVIDPPTRARLRVLLPPSAEETANELQDLPGYRVLDRPIEVLVLGEFGMQMDQLHLEAGRTRRAATRVLVLRLADV